MSAQEQEPGDCVPVAVAARAAGVPTSRVYTWVERRQLSAWTSTRGRLVSQAAVLALAAALIPEPAVGVQDARSAAAPEFVSPARAAQLVGLLRSAVAYWGRTGMVRTAAGPYGHLVHLADVDALARARAAHRADQGREYVTPGIAAARTKVHVATIRGWGKQGRVRTQAGPHGQLVHLADVEARAAERSRPMSTESTV